MMVNDHSASSIIDPLNKAENRSEAAGSILFQAHELPPMATMSQVAQDQQLQSCQPVGRGRKIREGKAGTVAATILRGRK